MSLKLQLAIAHFVSGKKSKMDGVWANLRYVWGVGGGGYARKGYTGGSAPGLKPLPFNPRTYKQKSHPHNGTGGGGLMEPLPWVFAVFQYLGEILALVESLWCALQHEVYIMGWGAAGGL